MIRGIAIDWKSRNIYLADRHNRKIVVCGLDTKSCKNLLTEESTPTSIALDIKRRYCLFLFVIQIMDINTIE